jgi:hypothetical protein
LIPTVTDRSIGDLTLTDLHHQRVDQHHRVNPVQRPRLPGREFVDDLVGDPGDQVTRHLGVVDVGQVGLDLAGRQPLGIQRDDRLVEPFDAAGVLGHDLRLEPSSAIPGHLQLDRADLGLHRLG